MLGLGRRIAIGSVAVKKLFLRGHRLGWWIDDRLIGWQMVIALDLRGF
jgi:hypothetical protein